MFNFKKFSRIDFILYYLTIIFGLTIFFALDFVNNIYYESYFSLNSRFSLINPLPHFVRIFELWPISFPAFLLLCTYIIPILRPDLSLTKRILIPRLLSFSLTFVMLFYFIIQIPFGFLGYLGFTINFIPILLFCLIFLIEYIFLYSNFKIVRIFYTQM